VPFMAVVMVDADRTRRGWPISLQATSVSWHLRGYLERSGMPLTLSDVHMLLPDCATQSGEPSEDLVNISQTRCVPTSGYWRYFGLTSDPFRLRSASDVQKMLPKCHVVLFAARSHFAEEADVKKVKKKDKKKDHKRPVKKHKKAQE